jgi:hypothetical protein
MKNYHSGARRWLRLREKGGKEKELPVHHKLEELLDEYLKATGLEKEPGSPLFPASIRKTGKLSRRPLVRTDAADMLKRRLKQAGLPAHYSPHSFRATGITNFLENDGTLEAAQRIAGRQPASRVSFSHRSFEHVTHRAQCDESGQESVFQFQYWLWQAWLQPFPQPFFLGYRESETLFRLWEAFGFTWSLGNVSRKFFPQSHIASMIGFRAWPRLEMEYSTFGGT